MKSSVSKFWLRGLAVLLSLGLTACDEDDLYFQNPLVPQLLQLPGPRPAAPPASTPVPTPAPTVASYRTIVTAMTTEIVNNAADQYLVYVVSFQGPDGNPAPLPIERVLFDIDGVGTNISSAEYEVDIAGQAPWDGHLNVIRGADLFGNVGTNFFHWATEDDINVPVGIYSFTFTVDLSFTINHLRGSPNPPPRREVINTFVKLGLDSLTAATPITFINR